MAQHPPISSIATTSGVTTSALSVYMHHTWEALLVMSSVSLVLMSYGHVRLLFGKHALAKQQRLIYEPLSKKIDVVQPKRNYDLSTFSKPITSVIGNSRRQWQQLGKNENLNRIRHLLTNS